jgi:hypothetical protein
MMLTLVGRSPSTPLATRCATARTCPDDREPPERSRTLHELRQSERRPVEDLEPHRAARRQAFARQTEPQLIDLLLRNLDDPAVRGEPIGDVLLPQRRHDRRRVLALEVTEQDAVPYAGRVGADAPDERERGRAREADLQLLARRQAYQDRAHLLEQVVHFRSRAPESR